MTVFGDTNQSGLSVTFEGMEDLTLPAAGQARIEAVDGGFQWLNFHMTDPLLAFGEVEFNIDASADGSGTITFFDQFGNDLRSAERRVGKVCVSTGIFRWSRYHYKKNLQYISYF